MNHQNTIVSISSQKNTIIPATTHSFGFANKDIVTSYCSTDLTSERGKSFQIFRLGIVCFLCMILLFGAALIVVQHFTDMNYTARTSVEVLYMRESEEEVLHCFQLETFYAMMFVSNSSECTSNGPYQVYLNTAYKSTDMALLSLKWSSNYFDGDKETFQNVLNQYRDDITNASMMDKQQFNDFSKIYFDFYTSITQAFYYPLAREIYAKSLDVYSNKMAAYDLLLKAKYVAGNELAFYELFYLTKDFDIVTSEMISNLRSKILNILEIADGFALEVSMSNDVDTLSSMVKDHFRDNPLPSSNLQYQLESNCTYLSNNVRNYLDQYQVILMKWREDIIKEVADKQTAAHRYLSLEISVTVLLLLTGPLLLYNVCNMTSWIHQYSQQLQKKTDELKKEKKVTERLLYQMLPPTVADSLREKKPINAETFESVTIFFSDIVGFTSISAQITPLQVVEMLNSLYTCFDSRIDVYDVYKVETIGDAYMVVSGCPVKNEARHTSEIALMALDLRSSIKQVIVPHNHDDKLRLRIGIHTGPCVAGIVGSKMPRYCLFGDTVNTASRMESNSLPNMIHMSEAAQTVLKGDTSFVIEKRGEINIKGKGNMTTYWLISRDDYKEVNESMVCEWPAKRRKKKKNRQLSRISSIDSTVSSSGQTVANSESGLNSPLTPQQAITEKDTSALINTAAIKLNSNPEIIVSNVVKTELEIVSENPETGEKSKNQSNDQLKLESHSMHNSLESKEDIQVPNRPPRRPPLTRQSSITIDECSKNTQMMIQSSDAGHDSKLISNQTAFLSGNKTESPINVNNCSQKWSIEHEVRAKSTPSLHDVTVQDTVVHMNRREDNSGVQRYPSVPDLHNTFNNHPFAPTYDRQSSLNFGKDNMTEQILPISTVSCSTIINVPVDTI